VTDAPHQGPNRTDASGRRICGKEAFSQPTVATRSYLGGSRVEVVGAVAPLLLAVATGQQLALRRSRRAVLLGYLGKLKLVGDSYVTLRGHQGVLTVFSLLTQSKAGGQDGKANGVLEGTPSEAMEAGQDLNLNETLARAGVIFGPVSAGYPRDTARAMSEENVAVVQSALDAFARDGLDAMAEYWTDDIDHRAAEGAVDDRGPMHGKDAVRAYMQDWLDTFDDLRLEPMEVIKAGDDKVIAVLKMSGIAKLSGIETDLTYAVVYTIRDGKVARGREYMTREQALEAAGLSE
jgi:ketosteroid isomerase-like protein